MKERTLLIVRLISTHLIPVPFLIIITLLLKHNGRLLLAVTQSILLIVFLAGYWEFLGRSFRLIYCLAMEAIILLLLLIKALPQPITEWELFSLVLICTQLYLTFEILKMLIVIFVIGKNNVEINFPFHNGRFLITDGGNSKISRLMNYHFYSAIHKKKKTNNSMLFATDIVMISNTGKRFLPPLNKDYPIFGEKVYSPMSGTVVKVENQIEDNTPYSGNYPYNTGNTIVIQDNDKFMLLGHLKKDSIVVKVGQEVRENELLAEAGNSGYSERSHLHMQLIRSETAGYWGGTGISITFKGENLFKNRLIDIS